MNRRIVDLLIAVVSVIVAGWLILVIVGLSGSVGTVELPILVVVSCGIGLFVYRRRRKRAGRAPAHD